jgi:Rrf2 family protein
MLVTKEADYALRCVLEVAHHGRVSAARVAEIQGISPAFLGKIVQSLARAGILSTRRGVGGGVALAVPLESLTMLRVIEAVEGPLCINDCVAEPPRCTHVDGCPIYPYLQQAQGALRDIFTVSMAQLAAGEMGLAGMPPLTPPVAPTNGNGSATTVAGAVTVGGED